MVSRYEENPHDNLAGPFPPRVSWETEIKGMDVIDSLGAADVHALPAPSNSPRELTSLIRQEGPTPPLDDIEKFAATRVSFIQKFASQVSAASREELERKGIQEHGGVYSFAVELPGGTIENAMMSLHDGQNGTDRTKAHYFKLGDNALYFNGKGQMTSVELRWTEEVAQMASDFRGTHGPILSTPLTAGGQLFEPAKINFNFPGYLTMNVNISSKRGEAQTYNVDRKGKVDAFTAPFPEMVKQAISKTIPRELLHK